MTWWPGWDSIEGAKGWADFYFWFGIGCLVLLAVSEVISHRYGLRKDELVAAAEIATAKQRKADQDAADAHHAAEIGSLKGQLSEADKKLDEIERHRAARHLTDDQKAKMTEFLTKNTHGVAVFAIKASSTAPDGRAYADEISAFFGAPPINWTVKVDNAIIMGPDTAGIWIVIKDGTAIPLAAQVLHAALIAADIPVKPPIFVDPGISGTDEVWLNIGPKP